MNNNKFLNDVKVMSMLSLLEDIKFYPYAADTKKRILTCLDKYAVPYLINELPEGLTLKEYSDMLDDYVVNLIKKEMK